MFIQMEKKEFNVLLLNYLKDILEDNISLSSEDEEIFLEFIDTLKSKNIRGFLARIRPQLTARDKLNYNLFKSSIERDTTDNVNILI